MNQTLQIKNSDRTALKKELNFKANLLQPDILRSIAQFLIQILFGIYLLGFQNCSSFLQSNKTADFRVPETVRVRIAVSKEPLQVDVDGSMRITRGTGKEIVESVFNYYPEEYNSGDRVFIEPKKGKFKYRSKEYRGNLEIYRTPKEIFLINHLPLEDYLLSVVPSEMPPSWHMEALKAQAVAARTYAAYHITNSKTGLYDLETDTNSQVYSGVRSENPNSSKAVRDTRSMVMVYNNLPIKAFFHSHSGGVTESPEKVWGQRVDYLKSVKSEFCNMSKPLEWELKLDLTALSGKLNKYSVGDIVDIKILETTPSGRVASLAIQGENGNAVVSGQEFRNLIGNTRIKSLLFDIIETDSIYHFKGKGFGHGVGMSQYGSYGMALQNYSYEDILKYYYKNIELVKLR